ncbi:MAG: MBL fold metallo-hydrolase, partial [Pseudomonadota bacterium]
MTQLPSNPDATLRRRSLLKATAALGPLAAGLSLSTAQAGGHAEAQPNAIKHSFSIGDLKVSTLLAGTRTVESPQNIFGMNVDAETFERVSAEHFLPVDAAQFFFTPTVVQNGTDTVLFDTGLNADSITAPLMAAGVAPDDVTIVVITHMHGDHIGGLLKADGSPTFPNARYVTGQVEFDAWAQMGNERFDKLVRPLAENMSFLGAEDAVISGVTAHAAFGHTPGHMAYRLESGGEQLMLIADAANHYLWSVGFPDWEVKFDRDKAAAAATRKALFGMLAAERIPFVGYHMPFPGIGYVEARA